MLMPLFKMDTNPIMNMTETSPVLDFLEKFLGTLCIVLLVFLVHKNAMLFSLAEGRFYFILAIAILLTNYIGWGLYFTGHQSLLVMMLFLVALPPLYYVAIGLWRQNGPLAAVGTLFFIIHFVHVFGNLKP